MNKFKHRPFSKYSGNITAIILVVIALVAAGGLGYYYWQNRMPAEKAQTAAAETQPQQAETAAGEESEIEPGNPVVARVGDKEIRRMDVFNYIQSLPQETRKLPLEQLFPAALEQVINAAVINQKTQNVNLEQDPRVQKQLEAARQNIMRTVYLEKKVEEKLTEDRLKEAYEKYKAGFPDIQEVQARHILVKEKDKAKELIKDLKDGADFAALARENSIDGTAETGGEVGWFAKTDVVPEFAEAAFALDEGEMTQKPVETEFGYHVIRVEGKRKRPVPPFAEAKPFLEAQLRRVVLDEIIQGWREQADIDRYSINGKPIEPAAGNTE